MSQLKTYHYPEDHRILSLEGSQLAVHLAPGAWVRHGHFDGTMGVLIANGDDFVTVLWSRPPTVIDVGQAYMTGGYVFAPYVPLQVTPTLFAPSGSHTWSTGSVARYSKQLINRSFFVTGSVV